MNSKDCEQIGHILARTWMPREVCELFFDIDARIRDEWESYSDVYKHDEAVMSRFDELMVERFGYDWAIRKASAGNTKTALEQARRDVYGDDYHPSLFK